MQLLGTKVVPVKVGQRTLKEAVNEAMRDWVTNVRTTHYILGTVYGAHPYPAMVRDFQKIIGEEARQQIQEKENKNCLIIFGSRNQFKNIICLGIRTLRKEY